MSEPENESFQFEAGVKRLETLVQQMESGELSLEKSMRAFEEGMNLVKKCQKQLNEVEKKIEILSGNEDD